MEIATTDRQDLINLNIENEVKHSDKYAHNAISCLKSVQIEDSNTKFQTLIQKYKERKYILYKNHLQLEDVVKRLMLKRYLNKEFEVLYKSYTLSRIQAESRTTLNLNMKNFSTRKLVESASKKVLPTFLCVETTNTECVKSRILTQFIENWIP